MHSLNPWIVVLAEVLQAGKANPYLVEVFISVRINNWHFQDRMSSVVNFASSDHLISLRNCAILVAQCWSLLLTCWTFRGSSNQTDLGKCTARVNDILGTCMQGFDQFLFSVISITFNHHVSYFQFFFFKSTLLPRRLTK